MSNPCETDTTPVSSEMPKPSSERPSLIMKCKSTTRKTRAENCIDNNMRALQARSRQRRDRAFPKIGGLSRFAGELFACAEERQRHGPARGPEESGGDKAIAAIVARTA